MAAGKIRFRVAGHLAAWSAGDYDLTFEAGVVHELPASAKKGLVAAVGAAADAGSIEYVEDEED